MAAWLEANHAGSPGAWLVCPKPSTGRETVSYEDAVRHALCFGWVDSQVRAIDDERGALLFTPRKPGSGWAGTNKRRIEELEAAGLMRPAGRALIDAAKADGSWTLLDDVEAGIVPEDLAEALGAHPAGRATWDAYPPACSGACSRGSSPPNGPRRGRGASQRSPRRPPTAARRTVGPLTHRVQRAPRRRKPPGHAETRGQVVRSSGRLLDYGGPPATVLRWP